MTADARLRRDIGWNLVPVALLAVVGLGLNFVIGGWWGPATLGTFNLVTTAFFAFAVVGACGLQYAVLRAVAEDPDDRDRVAAVVVGALLPNVALAAAAAGGFALSRHAIGELLDSPAVEAGMLVAAPGLFCFALNKVLLGVVNGLRRMRAFAIYTSLRYVLIAVGLVIARLAHAGGAELPVIWTFTEGALLVVLVVELLATVPVARARRAWLPWARRHLDFGVRGVTATLAYEINSKLDLWMLGMALPEAQVGIYSLAAALNEGALQLAVVVQNNVNPIIARELAAGERGAVEELVRRTRRWFVPAIFVLATLGALLYPLVIPWLIGNQAFAAGAWPFAILMGGLVVAAAYLPFNQILLMAHQPGWHTLLVLGVVAVNLAANLALIPVLGLRGAALAVAAALATSAALVRVLARARVGVRI